MIETEIGKIVPLNEKIQFWDVIKRKSLDLSQRLSGRHDDYAQRLERCCELLKFKVCPNGYLFLKDAQFCRVRGCPICEWRRSRKIASQVGKATKEIAGLYPNHKYMSISLPVPPCKVSSLPVALSNLRSGYRRLSELKVWIPDGWLTFLNISFLNDMVLLKLNCLCFVPSRYFAQQYISKRKWSELWSQSLRIDTLLKIETHGLGKLPINYAAHYAKKLSCGLDLSLCSDEILVDVINGLHQQKMFTASGLFKDYLDSGDRPAKKYYPSEKAAIQSMKKVYYANLPNPENDEHIEQYLMLDELPTFEDANKI